MDLKIDTSQLRLDLTGLNFTQAEKQQIAGEELKATVARLQKATLAGRDKDGSPLRKYAASYIKAIEKGWVKAGGVRKVSTATNLTITGRLLQSIQVDKEPNGARAGFLGSHYGGLTNAGLALELIKKGFVGFFGFGKVDVKRIRKVVSDRMAAKKSNLRK